MTPDAVRALIAEAELWPVKARAYEVHFLIARLASALSDFLPREDADLDAIESRAAWAGSYSTDGVQAAAERFRIARVDVPALIARVRTAEAGRDRLRDAVSAAAYDLARDDLDQVRISLDVALGRDENPSRTVEAAQEWAESHHSYGTGYCGDSEKEGGTR